MHVDRRNTRADHFEVTDVELRGDGTPIMLNLPGGIVVSKTIEYTTTMCPECVDHNGEHTIPAWVDHLGDEICPECGMICNGNRQILPEDYNFSARGGFESSGFPALNDAAPVHDRRVDSESTTA
ncbi:hypothetical protein ACFQGT_09890 [Natrialbaceae archaeon GCM10025810]|uniref:hypothetical protein n=1 Tax=Halovalidus salilacus TaxID=3075124 RepID=UPI00360E25CF